MAERAGDFSCFLVGGSCATSAAGTIITNPLTGAAFPGNIIPQSMFNSVDTQLLDLLYPLPTTSGTGTNTFQNIPYSDNVSRFSVHIDHKINENNQIRGTVLDALYGPNPSVGGSTLQGGMSGIGEHVLNVIAGATHTFSPTLLLDVYGSYFHLPIYRTPQNVNTDFAAIIPELAPQLIEGAPQIGITNISGVGEQGSKDLEQDAQIDPTITKTLAKHSIKAGFSYVYENHWNTTVEGPQRGSFSFNGRYTGIAFADFLLGDPSSTGQTTPADAIYRNISSQLGFFVQDDYKVTRQLTINAGIRYDLQVFKNNQYPGEDSLFVPSVGKVVVFANSYPAQAQPAFIPDTVLAPSVGLPASLFGYLGQDTHNVAPRFGFAFQPATNTVIRGAVGLFFDLLPGTYEQSSAFTNLPFEASESYSQPATGGPAFTMNDPFSATGTFSANPSAIAQHSTVTPYTEQFNLAVEHQLHGGLDIRVGYVGQHNVKQNNLNGSTLNINAIPVPIVGVNAQNTNLYQPFSTIDENGAPIFHSTMDALQIGIHKQYSHGFQLNAEYEWSRILGTTSLENPSGVNVNDSYGPIGGTAPQVLAVSYSYELPFGQGKLLFGNAPSFADKIIRGWQVSGITSISSGGAFSVGYSAPGSPTGLASGRANQVPGVPLYPKHKTLAEWFNPAAFTAPPCYNSIATGPCASIYTPGGPTTYSTYGTSGNNMLRGPAYQDWDISLEKNTLWRERYRVQLRAESFNIFNHPNFGGPNTSINDTANVGTITGTSGEPRTVEFAAKFNF